MHEHSTAHETPVIGKAPVKVTTKPVSPNQGSALEHIDLSIGGMTCPHCPPIVEAALLAVPGVQQAHVNLATRRATIAFDPEHTKVTELLQAIRRAGYTPGTAKTRLPIANMHCSSCVVRIELEVGMTPGVIKAEANSLTNAVEVEYQPEKSSIGAIEAAIERAGYRVVKPNPAAAAEAGDPEAVAQTAEYDLLMRKFWFAAAISVPVMVLSYPDLIPGLREWMPMGSERNSDTIQRAGSSALSTVADSRTRLFMTLVEMSFSRRMRSGS